MSKNYDQYEVKITPMQKTSFDDGTWFYFVNIYYHEAPLFTYDMMTPIRSSISMHCAWLKAVWTWPQNTQTTSSVKT